MKKIFGIDGGIFIGFIFALAMLGFGIYIWYGVDSAIDYDILNEQFRTNQTFVDTLECDKIELAIATLPQVMSPTQQDEVEELLGHFKDVYIEKNCESEIQK